MSASLAGSSAAGRGPRRAPLLSLVCDLRDDGGRSVTAGNPRSVSLCRDDGREKPRPRSGLRDALPAVRPLLAEPLRLWPLLRLECDGPCGSPLSRAYHSCIEQSPGERFGYAEGVACT